MARRKHDYDVAGLNKRDERKGRIGRAWKNDDGSIVVVLNPFIVVHGGLDMLITLFPVRMEEGER